MTQTLNHSYTLLKWASSVCWPGSALDIGCLSSRVSLEWSHYSSSSKRICRGEQGFWLWCLHSISLGRMSRYISLGGEPEATPELTGGIIHLLWYWNTLESLRRCWRVGNQSFHLDLLPQWWMDSILFKIGYSLQWYTMKVTATKWYNAYIKVNNYRSWNESRQQTVWQMHKKEYIWWRKVSGH